MNFFADEGLDVPLVQALREAGFVLTHALETMRGTDDETILSTAVKLEAILITKDKDFGEMVIRNKGRCKGVVLIRIDDLSSGRNSEHVVGLLSRYAGELPNNFTVIQEDKIRIRKLE